MASCQQQLQQQQQHCDCQTRCFAIVVDETCEPFFTQHGDNSWRPMLALYPPVAELPQANWPIHQYRWPMQPCNWLMNHYQQQQQQQHMMFQYYPFVPAPAHQQVHQLYRSHYHMQHQQIHHHHPHLPYTILNDGFLLRHHRPFGSADGAHPTIYSGSAPTVSQDGVSTVDPSVRARLDALLPIDAQPARTRQAYGMDKVWLEEFENLFARFLSAGVLWNLLEVESNPNIREVSNIIGYRGRYIVDANRNPIDGSERLESHVSTASNDSKVEHDDGASTSSSNGEENKATKLSNRTEREAQLDLGDSYEYATGESAMVAREEEDGDCDGDSANATSEDSSSEYNGSNQGDDLQNDADSNTTTTTNPCSEEVAIESDQDSGCQVNSDPGSDTSADSHLVTIDDATELSSSSCELPPSTGIKLLSINEARKFPTRFRMFIDSAKVRFCCDTCGHGWTSMKGRVVFWYELFELIDHKQALGNSLIGYCAYKLFGQQCDICKVENRFEKPMWYPEEVIKVLNNLYNKIGQVYFGFEMPAIDKQRRAGKPKTSHNSSLCQACHDGVCTDRK